ncbi:MAG: nucleoside-diphosphate sugar epimerase/dehydratase [Deltaproteobacteria bacterium]|nr:nucleoside-diphosphate sugar epimerase/dehydratase [Deltaproteobacteria bacterium]
MTSLLLTYRRLLIVSVYVMLWVLSYASAFMLRFEFSLPQTYAQTLIATLPAIVLARFVGFGLFGMFHGMWRYTSGHDLRTLVKAATFSSVLFAGWVLFFNVQDFPRSILISDWAGNVMLIGGLRFLIRSLNEASVHSSTVRSQRKRVLIVGAGNAGEMLLREMLRAGADRYLPIGFLDDSQSKVGERIHGIPVLATTNQLPQIAAQYDIDEAIVAIPSASRTEMKAILDRASESSIRVRTVPGMSQLIDGQISVQQLRDVQIEDLLGRDPISLDDELINTAIRGGRVLVTGAGGSIGSEICRQVCRFQCEVLILVEQAENALYEIHRELSREYPNIRIVPIIADVTDVPRMEDAFRQHRPIAVFHAAAHKHVPMMEWNPGEAVKNNIFGTRTVADLADAYKAERFVMISTDKAVNPTSVMGASKRVAEIYVQALSQRSKTRFVTVRFGNVLGSNGSVVPLFKEQISKGGPITVTHPDMQRYFMTIPEACQLVLQAGAMGQGGEIFILDMGDPVKIVDLARDLIRLSGLREKEDIEIHFTGLRPGEKLFEELSVAAESADRTKHPKIFVGRFRGHTWTQVTEYYTSLEGYRDSASPENVRAILKEIVPEYTPHDGALSSKPTNTQPAGPIRTRSGAEAIVGRTSDTHSAIAKA